MLTFLPVVLLLVAVPGTNNLVVLRAAVLHGATGATGARATTLGTSAGIAAWSVAVGLGLGALVAALPGGLETLRTAGSLAMVAMGLWALRPARSTAAVHSGAGFAAGLGVSLANPRTALTAVSLLPQHASDAAGTVALGLEWALVAGAWNLVLVALLRGRGRPRLLARAGGLVVLGVGCVGLLH